MVLGSDGWRPIAKPAPDPAADAEFQAALKLFQQGKFEEAEKQFAKIAKNRKETTWGENAQFYLAECQFQRKKYVNAHDSYEKLHADYPATEYLDKLTQREYEIAQIWLAQDRSQGARREEAAMDRAVRRAAPDHRHPWLGASRRSSTSSTTTPTARSPTRPASRSPTST